jgi:hypothetical protein
MFKGVELILITRQETIFLPRAKSIISKGVPMAIRMKYNEPKFNQ